MKQKEHSKISLSLDLSFIHLNKLLDQKLNNIELKKGVIVNKVLLSSLGDRLSLEIGIYGIIDTIVQTDFVVGVNNQQISLDDFRVKLESVGMLGSGINFMIERWFRFKLQSRIENILNKKLNEMIESVIRDEKRIPMAEGFFLGLKIDTILLKEAHSREESIHFLIHGDALIEISA